jgi:hypothetical protein
MHREWHTRHNVPKRFPERNTSDNLSWTSEVRLPLGLRTVDRKLSGDGLGSRAGLRLVPGGEGRGFDSRGSAGEGAAELLSVFGSRTTRGSSGN